MKTKKEEQQKAIELRKQGLSYREIKNLLKVSKGTLSLWLKEIAITPEQKERLEKRKSESAVNLHKRFSKEKRKRWSSKGGKNSQAQYGHRLKNNLIGGNAISVLTYRKDEIPIKNQLEKITKETFNKKEVDGQYCDFVNDKHIIEHTIDITRGTTEAINRLNSIKDKRTKILITQVRGNIGPKRQELCKDITILDVADFWKGTWI